MIFYFLGSSNSRRNHWILKLVVATWKSEVWEQKCVWLFYRFNFERTYDVLKSRSPYILLKKKIFNKNETESRMENLTHIFRETNFLLQLIKESQIKSKTVISWKSRKKKVCLFCTVYFVQKKCFKHLCFISFVFYFGMYTFTYQKTLPHTIFCLFLKLSKPLHASLK